MRKNRNCVKYVGEKIAIALISRAYCRNTGGSESSDLWKSHISIFHQTKERKTYYLHLQFFWSRQSTNKCGAGYLWGKGIYSLRQQNLFLWNYSPPQVSWDDPLKIMVETIWEAILKRLWSLNFIGPSAGSLSAAKSSITSFSTQLTRGLSILAIFLLIKGSRQSNNISGETFQDWRSRTSSWEPPVCQED